MTILDNQSREKGMASGSSRPHSGKGATAISVTKAHIAGKTEVFNNDGVDACGRPAIAIPLRCAAVFSALCQHGGTSNRSGNSAKG